MKINRTIVREMLTVNVAVAKYLNKMSQQHGHLDEPDMVIFNDAQLKLKFLCRTYPEEWAVFQSRNKQTNEIEGLQ